MLERRKIHLGRHGEDYGNWMSNQMLYVVGGLTVFAAVLAILSFTVSVIPMLTFLFMIIAAAFLAILAWIAWIRWQYSFSGGGIMDHVYQTTLPYMDYDGKGTLLEIDCGSGAWSIYAALTRPETKVIGVDYWGDIYHYSRSLCEKNALTEGVADRCEIRHGDANTLDFPNESVDSVVSNYVYHNIMGADKQKLLLETLQVLKKGAICAINDDMKLGAYGDIEVFAKKLWGMGYEDVRLIDTAKEIFGFRRRAAMMMFGHSQLLVGRK